MAEKFTTYAEFWPHYLREHARANTRRLHYLGTTLAIVLTAAAIAMGTVWLIAAALPAGYLFAWIGHFLVERNRPATFSHPIWSLISDFRMYFLWLGGQLNAELRDAGIR